jgi:hypothetical protein
MIFAGNLTQAGPWKDTRSSRLLDLTCQKITAPEHGTFIVCIWSYNKKTKKQQSYQCFTIWVINVTRAYLEMFAYVSASARSRYFLLLDKSLLYPEWYQCKSSKMKREWRFKPLQITNVLPVLLAVSDHCDKRTTLCDQFYLSYESTPAHKNSSSWHSTCSNVYTPTTIKRM